MKKKLLVLCLCLAIVPAFAFASFIQMGVTSTWDVPFYPLEEETFSFDNIDFGDYEVGVDMRLNIAALQLQCEMRGGFSDELLLTNYSYYLASSLKLDIFFLRLSAGLGIEIAVDRDPVTNDWQFNRQGKTDGITVLSTSELYYRAGLGIDFGPASLEIQAMVPTGGATYEVMSTATGRTVFDVIGPKFEGTRISVGLMANFF